MRLTRYTDYSLRALIYLGAHPGRLCSIPEIAGAYGISHNHLIKVTENLRRGGYVASVRGRFGGLRLALPAERINVGALVRATEDDFRIADCARCAIASACSLRGAFDEALEAFLAALDRYDLSDLVRNRAGLLRLLDAEPRGKPRRRRAA